MGVSVSAVSVVGKDEYGDKMREALAAEGFDISHLRVEDGDTSVMLMALKDGVDRVHLEAIDGVMETYRPNEDDRAFILEHDIIHTDLFGNCLASCPNGMMRARRWLWTSRCSARIPNMHVRLIFLT